MSPPVPSCSSPAAPIEAPCPEAGHGAGEGRASAETLEDFLRRQARVRPRDVARHVYAGSLADAEDARQAAALEWLERRHELAAPSREGSWWATLKHRVRRLERKRCTEEARGPDLRAHIAGDGARAAPPEAEIDRARIRAWCLAQIDPSRREVAERNLIFDETLEQIAAEQKRSIGTVRSQLARSKKDLQAAVARLPEKERRALHHLLATTAVLLALWVRFVRRARGPRGLLVACAGGAAAAVAITLGTARGPAAPQGVPEHHLEWGADTLVPYLPAWAERGSEASETPPPAPARSPRAAGSAAAGRLPARPSSGVARALLSRAQAALDAGDVHIARGALDLYDATYSHDPYPGQRADVARRLESP